MELDKKLILVFSISLAASLGMASAQTSDESGGIAEPATDVAAEYKFDAGFYQKIQDLIESDRTGLQSSHQKIQDPALEGPRGSSNAHDDRRYYNVIIVVGRDGGNLDDTARQNKDSIVRHLNVLGARDIVPAKSLSFVTASIPVSEIPGLSLRAEIRQMGDGEMPVTVQVDRARQTVHATPSELRQSTGGVPNGTGVVVAVVDTGINNPHLNSKVVDRAHCGGGGCTDPGGYTISGRSKSSANSGPQYASHGTQVAQIIAASGMRNNNGMAPGVTLADAIFGTGFDHTTFLGDMMHSVDWSYSRADVINISAGNPNINCNDGSATTYSMIINEAVDRGAVVVNAAGNFGNDYVDRNGYQSITAPTCARNAIVVGGVDDRGSEIVMARFSSRGPVSNLDPRLAPHIVAPGVDIQTLDRSDGDATSPVSGTSFATPQVSAAAAILLQADSGLTPAGVRAALLLGADWTGPVPCTSAQYEQNRAGDSCSFARQPANLDAAASTGVLNNAGFGILNVAGSLGYVNSSSHIIQDHLDAAARTRIYELDVTDTSGPVKVILTWMVDPAPPFADLNLEIITPEGLVIDAGSVHQTTEFAVFDPPARGTYIIKVQGQASAPFQTFALASTSSLTPVTIAIDTIESKTVNVHSTLRLNVTVQNATGPVRYSIDPLEGARIHPVSGHLVYVPVAGHAGTTQTLTVQATDTRTTAEASITIRVAVGAPLANVTGIQRQPDGTHTATVEVGSLEARATFASITAGVRSNLSSIYQPPANATAHLSSTDSLGDGHPQDDTIYYFSIWTAASDAEDDRIYARFTPGLDGFGIIPNPNTRPALVLPDIVQTAKAGRTLVISPELSDNDGNLTRITMVTDGAKGDADTDGTTITYKPHDGELGDDTITYRLTDNRGVSSTGAVDINIVEEMPPNAPNVTRIVMEDSGIIEINMAFADLSDPDGGPTGIRDGLVLDGLDGKAAHQDRIISYTPAPDEYGTGTIEYTVFDDEGDEAKGYITITMIPTPDPFEFEPAQTKHIIDRGSTFRIDLNASDPDVDDPGIRYGIVWQNPEMPAATIDAETGQISWTQTTAESVIIRVRATATDNSTADIALGIAADDSDDAGFVITGVRERAVIAQTTIRQDLGTTAAGPVQYSLDPPVPGARIYPTGHLVYVPYVNQTGPQILAVRADNGVHSVVQHIGLPVTEPFVRINSIVAVNDTHKINYDRTTDDWIIVLFVGLSPAATGDVFGGSALYGNRTGNAVYSDSFEPAFNTMYYVEIWRLFRDGLSATDNKVLALFTPGKDGFEIVPDPRLAPGNPPHAANTSAGVVSTAGNTTTVTPAIGDPDGNAVRITSVTDVDPDLGNATHNDTTVTYAPLKGASGTDQITYTVTDSTDRWFSARINVTVMSPPVVAVDDSVTYSGLDVRHIDVLGNDRPAAGLAITGVVSNFEPAHDALFGNVTHNGTHLTYEPGGAVTTLGIGGNHTYTVTDVDGNTDAADLIIAIEPPLATVAADAASAPPAVTFSVTTYVQNVTGRILDGNSTEYTFAEITAPAAGTVPAPKNVTVTGLAAGTAYTYQFARSSDTGYAGDDIVAGDFVTMEPPPIPIMLPATTNQTGYEGRALNYKIPVRNPENHSIMWTITSEAKDATIYDNGTFSWTPGEEHGGATHRFEFEAAAQGANTENGTLFVAVIETNQNPVFGNDIRTDHNTTVGAPFTPYIVATDADIPEQDISYNITLQQGPSESMAVMNATTGQIAWTPTELGNHTIRVLARDDFVPPGSDTIEISVSVVFVDMEAPTIMLAGNRTQVIELGGMYVELGAAATDDHPNYGVQTAMPDTSDLDLNSTGTYNVTYSAPADPAGKTPKTVVRTVVVRDTTKPVIMPNPPDPQVIEKGTTYGELNATVTDNDPNYTSTATVQSSNVNTDTVGMYTVTYTAPADEAGNAPDTVTRTVIVRDTTAPSIRLNGANSLRHELGTPYNDPGAMTDDGTPVTTNASAVNVNQRGDYLVRYTATDDDGNPATPATRIVQVRDTQKPVILLNGPPNQTVEFGGTYMEQRANVTDNDPDYNGTVTIDAPEIDTRNEGGVYTVTYSAMPDDAGNVPDEVIRTITIDLQPPAPNKDRVARNITGPDGRITVIAPVYDAATGSVLEAYLQRGLVVFGGILQVSEGSTIPVGAVRHDPPSGFAGFLHAGIIINVTDTNLLGAAPTNYTLSDITSQNDITVFINEIGNVPPVLSPVGYYAINAQDTLTFVVSTTDFNDTVYYMLSGAPDNATISRQGNFHWTPSSTDVGDHTFTITAYDKQGSSDTESVTIRVLQTETPNAHPTAPDVTAAVAPDGRAIVIPAISDPDGDPTRITGATGDDGGAITTSDNSIEYIAGPTLGTETITYTVVDSRGANATGTISVTIE